MRLWRGANQKIETAKVTDKLERYRQALELIAAPVRADGTYNRSREACEQLARDALAVDSSSLIVNVKPSTPTHSVNELPCKECGISKAFVSSAFELDARLGRITQAFNEYRDAHYQDSNTAWHKLKTAFFSEQSQKETKGCAETPEGLGTALNGDCKSGETPSSPALLTTQSGEQGDIQQRLLDACNGHPHAKIAWPHRLLHDAELTIGCPRACLAGAHELIAELSKSADKPICYCGGNRVGNHDCAFSKETCKGCSKQLQVGVEYDKGYCSPDCYYKSVSQSTQDTRENPAHIYDDNTLEHETEYVSQQPLAQSTQERKSVGVDESTLRCSKCNQTFGSHRRYMDHECSTQQGGQDPALPYCPHGLHPPKSCLACYRAHEGREATCPDHGIEMYRCGCWQAQEDNNDV